MKCNDCGSALHAKLIGDKWFVVCLGTCAGKSTVGSPKSNGKQTEQTAIDNFKKEESERSQYR